jgi:hypothetical protein
MQETSLLLGEVLNDRINKLNEIQGENAANWSDETMTCF